MRRKSRLLLNGDGTPVGGAWNFDAENRTEGNKLVLN
ncbi:deoxyribodipyrimidine photolyase-like protein protein, partial [Pseudomonas savastanoi pv. glycinea str. race 4]